MPHPSPYFLLPKGRHWHVARCEGTAIDCAARTPWSHDLPASLSADGRLAALSHKGTQVATGHHSGGRFTAERSFPLPPRYRGLCLKVVGDYAYIGGRCGRDMVGRIALAGPRAGEWDPLPKPGYFRSIGKAVDALLLRDNVLYAVDNICLPKFILTYRMDTPTPQLHQVAPLPTHGPYEKVQTAALGADFLAVMSTSVGRGGSSVHICLLALDDLREVGTVALHHPPPEPALVGSDDREWWEDFTVTGDTLWIAAGQDGLLRAKAKHRVEPMAVPLEAPGSIVRVTATPNGTVVALAETDGGLDPVPVKL